jgi:CDP-paratose synthetase
MKVLITGATGFVGKRLLLSVLRNGHQVAAIVRTADFSFTELNAELISNLNTINTADAAWKESVQSYDPEIVIHLASFLSSANNEATLQKLIHSNIVFGTELLDALKSCHSIKCFFNTGSFSEYLFNDGNLNPAYLYSASKTAFRSFLAYYAAIGNYKTIHIIPYSIYGYADSQPKLIDLIYASLEAPQPVKMSPGNQKLDFIHLDDVVAFYSLLIDRFDQVQDGETIYLGSGEGISPKQIAIKIESITGKLANIEWGGLPYRERDTLHSIAPIYKIEKIFNWKPNISFELGLKKYLENKPYAKQF